VIQATKNTNKTVVNSILSKIFFRWVDFNLQLWCAEEIFRAQASRLNTSVN